ncbi:FAD:protein FMN transferase [Parascardovia denticolens]
MQPRNQEMERQVYSWSHALGTGIILTCRKPLNTAQVESLGAFVEEFEQALSRFRPDSLVSAMADPRKVASRAGVFDFPEYCRPLFDLYDRLFAASWGRIDPCVGENLVSLGYTVSFESMDPLVGKLPAGRPRRTRWDRIRREGTRFRLTGPVHLDFGAVGKGYLLDLLARKLQGMCCGPFSLDAGGDLCFSPDSDPVWTAGEGKGSSVLVALEDPDDADRAIGLARLDREYGVSLCASAPSRRNWQARTADGQLTRLHHILDAMDGLPVSTVAASWVLVDGREPYPTAWADGLATALFPCPPQDLLASGDEGRLPPFDFLLLSRDGAGHDAESLSIQMSPDFPAELFLE